MGAKLTSNRLYQTGKLVNDESLKIDLRARIVDSDFHQVSTVAVQNDALRNLTTLDARTFGYC